MAAAIGEDRELIRRIYGKGFLNISDTERDACGNGRDYPAVYGK